MVLPWPAGLGAPELQGSPGPEQPQLRCRSGLPADLCSLCETLTPASLDGAEQGPSPGAASDPGPLVGPERLCSGSWFQGISGKGHTCVLGARVRYSACDKGHEEGGSTYAKAGSSLRSPPGTPRASTPVTRACLLYYFVLLPTPLTLRGAVPHHLFQRRS